MGMFDKITDRLPKSLPDLVRDAENVETLIRIGTTIVTVLAFAGESEEPMNPDPIVKIHYLSGAIGSAFEELTAFPSRLPPLAEDRNIITSSGTLHGCWDNPTTATESGNFAVNQQMYKNLAAFLTISGAPAKIEYEKKGNYRDVASLIAENVFPEKAAEIKDGNSASVVDMKARIETFNFPNVDGSCIVSARNVCYRVPLGDNAADTAWHGCLRIQTRMTKKFHQTELSKLPKRATPLPPTPSGDTRWLSVIAVDWGDSSTAQLSGQFIPSRLEQNDGYKVTMTSVIGITLTLQIKGPPGEKAADIQAKFRTAVADFIAEDGRDLSVMPRVDPISSTMIPRNPPTSGA